uniref:Ig-like domain-containing protein n=1 Tax=Sander lucioperca TaxID=283035 RepID=A0A8D0D2Y4_SANLU
TQKTKLARIANKANVTATEGEAVTLGCQYNSSSTNDYLFWYKQDGNNSPKFILSRFKVGTGVTVDKEKFSSTLNSSLRSVPLKIQKLQLSDSAVYYCALSKDNTILHNIHQRETHIVKLQVNYKLLSNLPSTSLLSSAKPKHVEENNKSSSGQTRRWSCMFV